MLRPTCTGRRFFARRRCRARRATTSGSRPSSSSARARTRSAVRSNKLPQLTPEQQRAGVICSSAGNHAQGVALAAAQLGIPAVVVMAANATPSKIAATKAYGAEVVLHGRIWDDANAEAERDRGRARPDDGAPVRRRPADRRAGNGRARDPRGRSRRRRRRRPDRRRRAHLRRLRCDPHARTPRADHRCRVERRAGNAAKRRGRQGASYSTR